MKWKSPICSPTDTGAILPFEAELSRGLGVDLERQGDEIPVVLTAAEERLGAAVAAMHSIYQNTRANVVFTIVTMNNTADHLK